MFKGGQGPAVAGPTGIAQGTGEVIKSNGWDSLLQFAALLSINPRTGAEGVGDTRATPRVNRRLRSAESVVV